MVCVSLAYFSKNVVGSVSATHLHYIFSLIQYSSNILRSLRLNYSHDFLPSLSSYLSTFFQRRKRGKIGRVKEKQDKRLYRPLMPSIMTGDLRLLNNYIDELLSSLEYHSAVHTGVCYCSNRNTIIWENTILLFQFKWILSQQL